MASTTGRRWPACDGRRRRSPRRPATSRSSARCVRRRSSTPATSGRHRQSSPRVLVFAALASLALTLGSSVRRRRHDLALLKTLGFTRRQLASTVRWQASVTVVVGLVVGVPLGVIAGRWLWEVFARDLDVVPEPSTPFIAAARDQCPGTRRRDPRRRGPRRAPHAASVPRASSGPNELRPRRRASGASKLLARSERL